MKEATLSRKISPPSKDRQQRRLDIGEARIDQPYGQAALNLHKGSKAHRGPGGTTTVRVTMRSKHTYDGASKLVRKMYDRTTKPRRKGKA